MLLNELQRQKTLLQAKAEEIAAQGEQLQSIQQQLAALTEKLQSHDIVRAHTCMYNVLP